MYATYKMNVNELDDQFLATLKSMFHDRDIEISVCEAERSGDDETAYLLRSPANRQHLRTAIESVADRQDLVLVDPDELR